MKTVSSTVEVAVKLAKEKGWSFPANHPTRTSDDGKQYYVVPVNYVEPESLDDMFSDDYIEAACKAAGFIDDDKSTAEEKFLKACYAGVKLAIGDEAKSEYAPEGFKKTVPVATTWAAKNPDETVFNEWRRLLKTADSDTANKYLVAEYRKSL